MRRIFYQRKCPSEFHASLFLLYILNDSSKSNLQVFVRKDQVSTHSGLYCFGTEGEEICLSHMVVLPPPVPKFNGGYNFAQQNGDNQNINFNHIMGSNMNGKLGFNLPSPYNREAFAKMYKYVQMKVPVYNQHNVNNKLPPLTPLIDDISNSSLIMNDNYKMKVNNAAASAKNNNNNNNSYSFECNNSNNYIGSPTNVTTFKKPTRITKPAPKVNGNLSIDDNINAFRNDSVINHNIHTRNTFNHTICNNNNVNNNVNPQPPTVNTSTQNRYDLSNFVGYNLDSNINLNYNNCNVNINNNNNNSNNQFNINHQRYPMTRKRNFGEMSATHVTAIPPQGPMQPPVNINTNLVESGNVNTSLYVNNAGGRNDPPSKRQCRIIDSSTHSFTYDRSNSNNSNSSRENSSGGSNSTSEEGSNTTSSSLSDLSASSYGCAMDYDLCNNNNNINMLSHDMRSVNSGFNVNSFNFNLNNIHLNMNDHLDMDSAQSLTTIDSGRLDYGNYDGVNFNSDFQC
jgi:hypothetical protein